VVPRERFDDPRGRIARAVIHHDQLEVGDAPVEIGPDDRERLAEAMLLVTSRDDHREVRTRRLSEFRPVEPVRLADRPRFLVRNDDLSRGVAP
jgi:hypothetical protein